MNRGIEQPFSFSYHKVEDQAVAAALAGRWEEAEALNRTLLERQPNDVDALNRLGKALMELGQHKEADASFNRVLEIDPYNRIARRNRERLASLLTAEQEHARSTTGTREQFMTDLFISESGKSALVPLRLLVDADVARQLTRGEIVHLEITGQAVQVKTEGGQLLGRLDPRVGHRLAEFMQGGNRYAAAIAEAGPQGVKVFVREIYQDPHLAGRTSFPPIRVAPDDMVRPYIRDLNLRLQESAEEDELDEEDEEEESELVEETLSLDEEDLLLEEEVFDDEELEEEF